MQQEQPQLVEAVVSISGNYCAWHESRVSFKYEFGSGDTTFLEETVADYIDLSQEEISAMDAAAVDKVVGDFVETHDPSYTDYTIKTVLKYNNTYYMPI